MSRLNLLTLEESAPQKPTASKLRHDLIPPHSLAKVAETMTVGADKHGATRYLDSPRRDEEGCQMASLLRHLSADRCGVRKDPDGFDHLAAVAARAMMILEIRRRAVERAEQSADKPNG